MRRRAHEAEDDRAEERSAGRRGTARDHAARPRSSASQASCRSTGRARSTAMSPVRTRSASSVHVKIITTAIRPCDDPGVGREGGRVVARDRAAGRLGDGEQDRELDDAEDRVGEHPGHGRLPVGRPAPEAGRGQREVRAESRRWPRRPVPGAGEGGGQRHNRRRLAKPDDYGAKQTYRRHLRWVPWSSRTRCLCCIVFSSCPPCWSSPRRAWSAAGPASAITGGTPTGASDGNVGGLVAADAILRRHRLYCSGTLISPTVVLTAAHCGEEGERVEVTFDPAYEEGDTTYSGMFHADPTYRQTAARLARHRGGGPRQGRQGD